MALVDDLISYWSLEEASGTRADSHGTNDLTDTNTVGSTTGKVGTAAAFVRANSERLSRADNASISLGADVAFTWCFWIRFTTIGTNQMWLVSKYANGDATTHEYTILIPAGGNTVRVHVGNGTTSTQADSLTALSTATWYFVSVWHDPTANQVGVAINAGTPVTASWSGGTQDTTFELSIGAYFGGAHYLDGDMDEIGFWKRTLTSAERTELYNAGAGRNYTYVSGGGGAAFTPRMTLLGVG